MNAFNISAFRYRQMLNCFLSLLIVSVTTPCQYSVAYPTGKTGKVKPFALNKMKARSQPSLKLIKHDFRLPINPTDIELSQARILPERLVPLSSKPIPGENADLSNALQKHKDKNNPEDVSDIVTFIKAHPQSRWIPALALNLGILRFERGYLSEAIHYWSDCWQLSKSENSPGLQAIASLAAANLASLYARLGEVEQVQKYLTVLKSQKYLGSAEPLIREAREGLAMMKQEPQNSFKCGPFAVNTLLSLKTNNGRACVEPKIKATASTNKGTNLNQINELAKNVGLSLQMAKKDKDAPLIVPSVMHWRTDHFAAITAKEGVKYRVQDPTFGISHNAWLTREALNSEGDGYFLVPAGSLPTGWTAVSKSEGSTIWGKGDPGARNPCKECEEDKESLPSCSSGGCGASRTPPPAGMAAASALSMNATVHIVDTPLEYSPPIGPDMDVTLTYNVAEQFHLPYQAYANLGADWSLNWISYLLVDPSSNLAVSVPGGGFEEYPYSGGATPYAPDALSHARMVPLLGGGYQRILPDGSAQNYTLVDPLGIHFFMTSWVDPQGNAATISYDSDYRVTSVTDACGNTSNFAYVSTSPLSSDYYLVASITDAFGRSASLTYSSNLLSSITDSEGNVSSFTYYHDATYNTTYISSMTTPYGTTTFTEIHNNLDTVSGWIFGFPDSSQAVIENFITPIKDTYYWDREAMATYPSDYTNGIFSHCKRTHFLWEPATNFESPIPAFEQRPLETMTFYTYPNQPDLNSVGSLDTPTTITRMLQGNRVFFCNLFGTVKPFESPTITFCDQSLPSGQLSISYLVQSGDSYSSIATALASAINADTNLSSSGITATANGASVIIQSLSAYPTSYLPDVVGIPSSSPSSLLMELDINENISESATIGGSATTGDFVTLTVINSYLSGGQKNISYTVQSGDDLNAIASGLSGQINSDVDMQSIGVSSTVSGQLITINSMAVQNTTYSSSVSSGGTETIRLVSNAQIWQYQYNSIGNITQSIDPVGRTFSYSYDTNNIDLLEKRETRGTDNFLMGHWEYNDSSSPHRVTLYSDGSNQQTHYSYNALKELETRTDANGATSTISYDSSGYLQQIDGPLAGTDDVTNFTLYGFGPIHTVTDSEGYQLTFDYDDLNRLVKTTYPDGTSETSIYDKLDAILQSDRLGRWTQSDYDSMDRLVSTTDPLGRKTKYGWCVCGGLASVTDPLGQTTSWARDLEGRVSGKTYADGTSTSYAYDVISGRLASKTDAAGQITTYLYFPDNTLAQRSYTNGYLPTGPTSYTYDQAFSRLLTADNSVDWGSISNSYNAYVTSTSDPVITGGGRLASVTSNNNYVPNSTVSYTYDALGRVSNTAVGGTGYTSSPSYDAMGRLSSEVNELGTFNYAYVDDVSGSSKGTTRLQSVDYPNGQITKFSYYDNDGDQRLKQISNLDANSALLSQFSYRYNAAGEIKQWPVIQNNQSIFNSLDYDAASQLSSMLGSDGARGGAIIDQNSYIYDDAANIASMQVNKLTRVEISGTVTTGDVLTITIADSGLTGGPEPVNYTVQPGDTTTSVAAGLAAAISANTNLQGIGVNAASTAAILTIQSVSQNQTTYTQSVSTGATESIKLGVTNNFVNLVSINGTKTTGDILTITVFDPALTGGSEAVPYTVQAGDTLNSIASALKNAINADTALQAIGVGATSGSNTVSISSASANATTLGVSTSAGATEVLAQYVNPNSTYTIGISGNSTASDTLTVKLFDPKLTGGSETINYVVQSGDTLTSIASNLASAINSNSNTSAIALNATASGQVISVSSNSINLTDYRLSVSSGATEIMSFHLPQNGTQTAVLGGSATVGDVVTLTVFDSQLAGGTEVANYTVQTGDNLANIAAGLASLVNANTNLQAINVNASSVGAVLNITSKSISTTTYIQSVSSGATETVFLAPVIGVTQFFCNNVNELTNTEPGGLTQVKATTNKALSSAVFDLPRLSLNAPSVNTTTYSGSSTGSETFNFGSTTNGLTMATLSGAVSTGDVVSLTVSNADLSGGSETVTYTAQSGDTLYTIADALASAVNVDTALNAVGQTAKPIADTNPTWSQKLSGVAPLPTGNTSFSVSATDGAHNTKSESYQVPVNSGASKSWTYDTVGNLSFGPAEGYSFTPDNRLQFIDFFTTGSPRTYFDYDALGRIARITVFSSFGVIASEKVYVWSGNKIIQEQDSSGNVTKDYYSLGEIRNSSDYFYTRDHLGSIRELTDGSSNIQVQYGYTVFGRHLKMQGSLDCDFQYAGYFYEPTSQFLLTRFRMYNPSVGRWISRDPIENTGNVFTYVGNQPIAYLDPTGLKETRCECINWNEVRNAANAGAAAGALIGGFLGGGGGFAAGLGAGGVGAVPAGYAGASIGAAGLGAAGGFAAGAANAASQFVNQMGGKNLDPKDLDDYGDGNEWSSNFQKNPQGDNTAKNDMARKAFERACKKLGKDATDKDLRRGFHDSITGAGYLNEQLYEQALKYLENH